MRKVSKGEGRAWRSERKVVCISYECIKVWIVSHLSFCIRKPATHTHTHRKDQMQHTHKSMHELCVCMRSGTVQREDKIRKPGQEMLSQDASLEASVLDQAVSTLSSSSWGREKRKRDTEKGWEWERERGFLLCVFASFHFRACLTDTQTLITECSRGRKKGDEDK